MIDAERLRRPAPSAWHAAPRPCRRLQHRNVVGAVADGDGIGGRSFSQAEMARAASLASLPRMGSATSAGEPAIFDDEIVGLVGVEAEQAATWR